jgi:hypothetical protein
MRAPTACLHPLARRLRGLGAEIAPPISGAGLNSLRT